MPNSKGKSSPFPDYKADTGQGNVSLLLFHSDPKGCTMPTLNERIKNDNILAMHALVESIIKEVRFYDGVDVRAPMEAAMRVNIELRIKAHMAVALGICSAGHVEEMGRDRLEAAQLFDARNKREKGNGSGNTAQDA